jgi:hypothetical protein
MAQVPPIDSGGGDDAGSDPQVEQSPSSSKSEPHRYLPRDVLPSVSSDERDIGWGDEPSDYSDDWYRSQRPPHHD